MAIIFAAAFGRIFPHALAAVNRGILVTASRNALRLGGLRFSNAAYSQAHAVAMRIATVRRLEATAVLTSRPSAARIIRGPWGGADRWTQVVRVRLRDIVTGGERDWYSFVSGDRLVTRQTAIDIAVEGISATVEEYGDTIITTIYDHTRGRP